MRGMIYGESSSVFEILTSVIKLSVTSIAETVVSFLLRHIANKKSIANGHISTQSFVSV